MGVNMSDTFTHGYALLVGVGASAYAGWSLPVTVKDARALRAALTDAHFCAYPDDADHVRLLHDAGATRAAILNGLTWLAERAVADPEATVVVYYSGHGGLDEAGERYYLLPHDVEPFDLPGSALAAQDFSAALREITARRLLVFVDSCHAQGMATAKDKPGFKLPPGYAQMALPKGVSDALKAGEGRAVFAASRGTQRSWVRPDDTLSIYTHHLLEALRGAGNRPGEQVVRVSNLMSHLGQAVPASARRLCQAEQTPFFDTATEDFAVALLRGGKGLPAGGWDAVQGRDDAPSGPMYQAEQHGDGAIAQGPGAVSAGAGGVAMGGSVGGDVVMGNKQIAFDQGQQQVGTQINVSGDYWASPPPGGTPSSNAPGADVTGEWDVVAIRRLLMAAFGDGELTTLCFDHFRPVYEELASGMSKGDKARRLVDYCLRQGQVARLLAQVKARNPAQYKRFAGRLR